MGLLVTRTMGHQAGQEPMISAGQRPGTHFRPSGDSRKIRKSPTDYIKVGWLRVLRKRTSSLANPPAPRSVS